MVGGIQFPLWQGFWGESSSDWHSSIWVQLPEMSVWLNHQWDSDVQGQDGMGKHSMVRGQMTTRSTCN